MHVKAKLRQFLREDEVEKPTDSKNWFLVRSDHDIHLATQENNLGFKTETNAEIGDRITVDNVTGELLCSFDSGFGVMDIFNYVMTEMNDLKSFLGLENCENTDKLPSLIIKSYLKFSSMISHPIWEPKVEECDFGYEGSDQSTEETVEYGEPSFPDFDEPNFDETDFPQVSTPSNTRRSTRKRRTKKITDETGLSDSSPDSSELSEGEMSDNEWRERVKEIFRNF